MPTIPHLPDRAPSLAHLLGEVLTPVQAFRLARHHRRLRSAPAAIAGQSGPVITIPGYLTPETSMLPLRAYLRWLGHDVSGWGLGPNTADVVGRVMRFVPRIRQMARERGPVSLIGWSLGGLAAREVAREAPDAVSQVVTIGTPVIGGPRWTNAKLGYRREAILGYAAAADARLRLPLPRPVTALVSKRDGIVAYRAQLDHHSEDVEHVEIGSTHLGMGVDPDVWLATAGALATRANRNRAQTDPAVVRSVRDAEPSAHRGERSA